MAEPLSHTPSTGSGTFHPSLGSPGDKLFYVPENIARPGAPEPLQTEQAAALVEATRCPDSEQCEVPCDSIVATPLVVSVPPSVVHNIFAHRQWRSGIILGDIVHASTQPQEGEFPLVNLAGKTVLELGAGTALPSILSALAPSPYAPRQVVITDYDEISLVSRLRANVRVNLGSKHSRVNVQGHVWGTNPVDVLDLLPSSHAALEPKFDVVFLADCFWDPLSHNELLLSVTRTLTRDLEARVYAVSGLHTGRDTLIAFIHRAHLHGLNVVPWLALESTESQHSSDAADQPPKRFRLRRASASEDSRDPLAHVLEAQLASDVDIDLDAVALHLPFLDGAKTATVSLGRRLTGLSRPFECRERPEEKREVHGVKERNKWIVAWALAWSPEAV